MKKKPVLVLYILLNIIISAATTLTVLWLWERANPPPVLSDVLSMESSQAESFESPNEAIPNNQQDQGATFRNENIQVDIRAVVGVGNLEIEYVELINRGPDTAYLEGWQLIGERGQQFIFPAQIVNSSGVIKVSSRTGTNTVIELFWQSETPIWQAGETVRLLDADGETITTYSIP